MSSSKYIAGRLQKELLKLIFNKTFNQNKKGEYDSSKQATERSLKSLARNGFIILSGEEIILTNEGKKILEYLEIDEITLGDKKWLGVWHSVAYDIPEEKKSERNIFRNKIKNLGFLYLQASLWVCPYECKEEIGMIADRLTLSENIIYLTTSKVPRESLYKNKYGLK